MRVLRNSTALSRCQKQRHLATPAGPGGSHGAGEVPQPHKLGQDFFSELGVLKARSTIVIVKLRQAYPGGKPLSKSSPSDVPGKPLAFLKHRGGNWTAISHVALGLPLTPGDRQVMLCWAPPGELTPKLKPSGAQSKTSTWQLLPVAAADGRHQHLLIA